MKRWRSNGGPRSPTMRRSAANRSRRGRPRWPPAARHRAPAPEPPRLDRRVPLHRLVLAEALADAVFDDAVADFVAVAHFDDLVGQGARALARVGIGEVPHVVLEVQLAAVVAVEPAVQAAVEAALQ